MTFSFEIVNIFAVFGTTFLMMALGVLWYTKPVFGTWVRELDGTKGKDTHTLLSMALSFLVSFIALYVVAYASALSPVLSLSEGHVALGLFAFAASLRIKDALTYNQTLRHVCADCLYLAVFIVGGTFIFIHWPS